LPFLPPERLPLEVLFPFRSNFRIAAPDIRRWLAALV
jgi:hypothetical protein